MKKNVFILVLAVAGLMFSMEAKAATYLRYLTVVDVPGTAFSDVSCPVWFDYRCAMDVYFGPYGGITVVVYDPQDPDRKYWRTISEDASTDESILDTSSLMQKQ
jgi:hypothetical protein